MEWRKRSNLIVMSLSSEKMLLGEKGRENVRVAWLLLGEFFCTFCTGEWDPAKDSIFKSRRKGEGQFFPICGDFSWCLQRWRRQIPVSFKEKGGHISLLLGVCENACGVLPFRADNGAGGQQSKKFLKELRGLFLAGRKPLISCKQGLPSATKLCFSLHAPPSFENWD